MIPAMLLVFALSTWALLVGTDDSAMRLALMGAAFCSGTMLFATLVQRLVRPPLRAARQAASKPILRE